MSGGDRAVALEAVDAALHGVALAVVGLVELRRPAPAGAALLPVSDLILLLRDRAADTASAQLGAVLTGAVGPVGADLVRPGARPSGAGAGHADTAQDDLELRGVAPLSGRNHQRHRLLGLLDCQVDLSGQSAAGASESVVVGLGEGAAGRLDLQIPLLRAPAACWCARAIVESTEMSQVIRPSVSARA